MGSEMMACHSCLCHNCDDTPCKNQLCELCDRTDYDSGRIECDGYIQAEEAGDYEHELYEVMDS